MKKTIHLPKFTSHLYAVGAVALLLWAIGLGFNLPTRHIVRHWDLVWVGFDGMIGVVMILTAFFATNKSHYVIISASTLGGLLFADAWFDILMARPGQDALKAIIFAVGIEIPVAMLSFFIAGYALKTFYVLKER
jgi:hypothetical protein